MDNVSSEEYLKARDDYDNTFNVIKKLSARKKELETKISECCGVGVGSKT
jgi:hypothetical protein